MGRETNEETIKQLNLNCSQVIRPVSSTDLCHLQKLWKGLWPTRQRESSFGD